MRCRTPMATNGSDRQRVLAISGSTRHGSTNTAFCRTAADCAPERVVVERLEKTDRRVPRVREIRGDTPP